jgi:hypothetical protein
VVLSAPCGVLACAFGFLERRDDSRIFPLENVLQNLTMSMMYFEGGIFTASELHTWLVEAGLKLVASEPVTVARPMVIYLAARN